MTTTTLSHFQVARDYCAPIKPTREYIQRSARIWFNQRKFRQRARWAMDFLSLPSRVTLKYKLY